MFVDSKYSKVLTIILVIVIVAIIILLGFLGFDYIKKYNASKQASDFVEDYQGDITTDEENNIGERTCCEIIDCKITISNSYLMYLY